MKLGKQVGLDPGHIVLDGDPAPPAKGAQPPPIFGPYPLRPNGCIDQDATWYGGRPPPRRLCVRWERRSPLPKSGQSPPIFGPCLLWPNGCMNQDGTCMEVGLSPGDLVVLDGDPAPSPIFGPFLLWPNGWVHQDATWYEARPQPRGLCVRWGPLPKKFRPMFIVAKRLDGSRCHLAWR